VTIEPLQAYDRAQCQDSSRSIALAPAPNCEAIHETAPLEASFEEIYDRWFDAVARWVRAFGAREADCDDLVQEVFVVVHRRLSHFDGANVAGWLYQIARRKTRDYRRLSWVKHFFAARTTTAFEGVSTSGTPLHALEASEKLQLLERLLATLKVNERATFILFEVERQSGEQIARLQNVPLNTVWTRLFKARHKLQRAVRRVERQQART